MNLVPTKEVFVKIADANAEGFKKISAIVSSDVDALTTYSKTLLDAFASSANPSGLKDKSGAKFAATSTFAPYMSMQSDFLKATQNFWTELVEPRQAAMNQLHATSVETMTNIGQKMAEFAQKNGELVANISKK
jgi:hypothetical protein